MTSNFIKGLIHLNQPLFILRIFMRTADIRA